MVGSPEVGDAELGLRPEEQVPVDLPNLEIWSGLRGLLWLIAPRDGAVAGRSSLLAATDSAGAMGPGEARNRYLRVPVDLPNSNELGGEASGPVGEMRWLR